jgi:hypothetical protein
VESRQDCPQGQIQATTLLPINKCSVRGFQRQPIGVNFRIVGYPETEDDWREIRITFITPWRLPQNWCKSDNVREILFMTVMAVS